MYLFEGFNIGPRAFVLVLHVSWTAALRAPGSSGESVFVSQRTVLRGSQTEQGLLSESGHYSDADRGDRVTFSASALKEVLHHVSAVRG